jgi:LysR family hydrogen peroxide-inducible transcriptional activator
MLSLKHLRYALAVEDTLHFYQAARQCAVSQSTLSAAINTLERNIGLQLFERDNKKVLVTPVGREFLARARPLLLQAIDLEQFAHLQSEQMPLQMHIGVIPTIAPYLLPLVLPALREAMPDARLYIREGQTADVLRRVNNGELDAAIIALPYATPGLLCFEFWQENFLWLGRGDVVTADRDISLDDLPIDELLLLEEGHCFKDHVLAVCGSAGLRQGPFAGSSLQTIVQMVAGGIGQTLIPELAREQLLAASPELQTRTLAASGPHRRLAFAVRPAYSGVAMI